MAREKAVLTLDDIRRDYKRQKRESLILKYLVSILVIAALVGFSVLVFDKGQKGIWAGAICIAVSLCIILYLVMLTRKRILVSSAIKKGTINIVTDKLKDRKEQAAEEADSRLQKKMLYFDDFGKFHVKDHDKYYTFDRSLRMDSVEFYESSKPGDIFYIVTYDNKKPILLYNTKYFEYEAPEAENTEDEEIDLGLEKK